MGHDIVSPQKRRYYFLMNRAQHMRADSESGFDVATPFLSPTSRGSLVPTFFWKEAPGSSIYCVGFPSHIWTTNILNEE
ncbi:hypothetical protein TNCV_4155701 [Trichonephila clavipes]|nr:hypothetical protein TNCV_4155701 [Trichonephila clavipes]